MNILALDQATKTGWLLAEPQGPVIEVGTLEIIGKNDVVRFVEDFSDKITPLVERADAVVFEKPILGANLTTAWKLMSIATEIGRVSKRLGKPCTFIRNTEAKKTGYGKCPRNKKPDDAVQRIAKWGIQVTNADEADAAAIWLEYVRLFHPKEFGQWLAKRAA